MGGYQLILLALLGFLFSFVNCQDFVLNAPQVLLPYAAKKTPPVTYILRANKGCFRWYVELRVSAKSSSQSNAIELIESIER